MSHFFPNYSILKGYAVRANIRESTSLAALDRYGLALVNEGHVWSLLERRAFEKRVRELRRTK